MLHANPWHLLLAAVALVSACAGASASPAGQSTTPPPVIGEGVCAARATCEGGKVLECEGNSECRGVDGVGCQAVRDAPADAADAPNEPERRCCDGTDTCDLSAATSATAAPASP